MLLPGAFFFPMGYVRSVLLLLAGSAARSSARLAVPELGTCASSRRAWRPLAAQHSQGRARPTGRPPTVSSARASRLQCRRSHYTYTIFRLGAARAARRDRGAATPACDAAAKKASTDGGAGGAAGRHAPRTHAQNAAYAESAGPGGVLQHCLSVRPPPGGGCAIPYPSSYQAASGLVFSRLMP